MKYIVKDPSGKTVLATIHAKRAEERTKEHPNYKLITIPETR